MEVNFVRLHSELEKYLNEDEIQSVKKAFIFAVNAHEGQVRKSGEPYIIHPISVAIVLAEQKLPVKVIISGLLHDVVEDTDVTMQELIDIFGQDVGDIVDGVTKLGNIHGMPTDQIKAANHRKIILATAKDVRVILVKLADRVHNMSTIEYMNEAKQKVIASETLEVYTPIAHRLGMYRIKWELEDLSFKVINKTAYDDIANKINMKREKREEVVRRVIDDTTNIIEQNQVDAKIKGRSKHIYSIYKKMKSKNLDFDELTDLFAFRIIVNTIPECYTVLGIIHENFKPIPMRFKDYIPTPKHNLYQSIHTTVINEDGFPVEFQIRTKEMDLIAEYGVASHWMYKSDSESDEVQQLINYQIDWLQQIVENNDSTIEDSLDFMNQVKNDLLSDSLIVYTPKGDVVELPVGSTTLDFAYYIHTDIGSHAVSAQVNDKVVSLFYRLQIGDVVEIITSPVAEPSIGWIQKVKTTRAQEQIKKYFVNMEKQQIRHEALKVLIQTCEQNGISTIKQRLEEDKIAPLLLEFDVNSKDQFLYYIGIGSIQITDVIDFINENKAAQIEYKSDIIIENQVKDYHSKMCRFCSPIPGDEIVANAHKEFNNQAEFMVHRIDCPHTNDESIIATWNYDNLNSSYPCRIKVRIIDEKNTVLPIFSAIADMEINITSIYFRASVGKYASGRISFEVATLKDYKLLSDRLTSLDVVKNVARIIEV